uniref:Putative calcineurin-like phosphoesterase n=1 Tax=viral metagenome TaxID=1070528 RepID=A0A6M3M2W3_9ZZZZ
MNILCLGDFHLTSDRPVNRVDDWWGTVKGKLQFVLDTAKQVKASVIIAPGDFTDSPSLPYSTYSSILSILQDYLNPNLIMLSCFGQHDMRYRTKENSALRALETALTPDFQIIEANEEICIDNTLFYGTSYGEEVQDFSEDTRFKVMIVHKMIIEEKLWSTQTGYETSTVFIRRHPYNLIVCGDNHQPFTAETKGGRVLINCGAMLRNSIDLIDHKPFVVLFDTNTKKYEKIYIPIKEGTEVFQMDTIEKTKERDKNLETFILGLSENKSTDLTFEDNLRQYIEENKVDSAVSTIIFDSMRNKKES